MAKFLKGNDLNAELEKIFEEAFEKIVLVSPYIKLHERYASTLKAKKDNPKLEIIVVFGKNEGDMSKSMKQEDFNFFKEFPNIQIRYEKRLHAKYYANDFTAILTSMNLYSYSQDNNIEAGVLAKTTLLGDSFDSEAWNYFNRVIEQSDLLFHKIPQYDSAMLGLTKKYKESKIEIDKLSDFFANKPKYEATNRNDNYEKKKVEQPTQSKSIHSGYCIRTEKPIPFNQKSL
ncbi:MAG: phospholipase D family protein [Bacteroidia bacterium]